MFTTVCTSASSLVVALCLLTTGTLCLPVTDEESPTHDAPFTSSTSSTDIIQTDGVNISKWSPSIRTTTVLPAPAFTLPLSREGSASISFDWTTAVGRSQTTKALASGSKVCFRVRILRMLFRLMLLKASGFNIQQLRASATKEPVFGERDFDLTDDDLSEICKELCG